MVADFLVFQTLHTSAHTPCTHSPVPSTHHEYGPRTTVRDP